MKMMSVEEFLKLVPGRGALVGALLRRTHLPRPRDGERDRLTVRVTESTLGRIQFEATAYEIVERPPLYQDPTARYCGWCKEKLYVAYSPTDGLTPGWCPSHGKGATVLHQDNSGPETEVAWEKIEISPKEKLWTPTEEKSIYGALGIPEKFLGCPPAYMAKALEAHEQKEKDRTHKLLAEHGLTSLEEFNRLAGTKKRS